MQAVGVKLHCNIPEVKLGRIWFPLITPVIEWQKTIICRKIFFLHFVCTGQEGVNDYMPWFDGLFLYVWHLMLSIMKQQFHMTRCWHLQELSSNHIFQPDSDCFHEAHFYIKAAKHDYKLAFPINILPRPLHLLCECEERLIHSNYMTLIGIEMFNTIFNHIHCVGNHSKWLGIVGKERKQSRNGGVFL